MHQLKGHQPLTDQNHESGAPVPPIALFIFSFVIQSTACIATRQLAFPQET